MPYRALEINLSSAIVESMHSFIPRGVHNLDQIYGYVSNEFGEFCDDGFKCCNCCLSNARSLEWHHIVRGYLHRSRVVRKAIGKGNWEFF